MLYLRVMKSISSRMTLTSYKTLTPIFQMLIGILLMLLGLIYMLQLMLYLSLALVDSFTEMLTQPMLQLLAHMLHQSILHIIIWIVALSVLFPLDTLVLKTTSSIWMYQPPSEHMRMLYSKITRPFMNMPNLWLTGSNLGFLKPISLIWNPGSVASDLARLSFPRPTMVVQIMA